MWLYLAKAEKVGRRKAGLKDVCGIAAGEDIMGVGYMCTETSLNHNNIAIHKLNEGCEMSEGMG